MDRARLEHAHRAVAAVRGNPGCVIGVQSAAVLHRLPLVEPLPPYVVLIAPASRWSGRRPGLLFRRMAVPADEFAPGAVPVTTAGRTWLDIACTTTLADAIAAGDAGLRNGILDPETMARLVDRAGARAGIRVARLAVQHVDALRETPLESASWVYFVVRDVPLPRLQVEIRDRDGWLIGRVDFAWDEARLVGEADGRLKYDTPDALYREKRREDGLREHGHRVIRWGWADLRDVRLAGPGGARTRSGPGRRRPARRHRPRRPPVACRSACA